MIEFAVRRFFRALTRFLFSVVLMLVAIEFAVLWGGREGSEEGRHVIGEILVWFTGDVPESLTMAAAAGPVSWWMATASGLLASLKVFGLSVLLAGCLGPPLGILAARFRRLPWVEPLALPLFLAACWPGFWLACLVIGWLVERWGQPGFADLSGENASGLESWWRAFLVAAIAAPGAVAWQIRSISNGIREAAKAEHVRGALTRGVSGSRLFYRHVFSSALDPVTRSLDRVLPILLGGQIFVEWVFRYPGLGTLMIESARNGFFGGLLAGGIALSLIIILGRFAGEILWGAADRRGRDRMAGAMA